MPANQRTPPAGNLSLLAKGTVEILGRMPWSSNHTFLVGCELAGSTCEAVYKPMAGERPLHDFDQGLGKREAAAYELSEALGWGLVPETIWREDAPLGPGSMQRLVDADYSAHYFTMIEDPEHHAALRKIAAFDVVANNADRKSGHCLLGGDGRIWAIDHGLCFHRQPKLRTVIWDFAGEELPEDVAEDLAALAGAGHTALLELSSTLLDASEVRALQERLSRLLAAGQLPAPAIDPDDYSSSWRYYPWPLV